jgi:hypothetical protein
MINISGFLNKFLKLDKDNESKKDVAISTIKFFAGIDVPVDRLEIKGDKLFIKCSPSIRNEIFMHQESIKNSLVSQNIFLDLV